MKKLVFFLAVVLSLFAVGAQAQQPTNITRGEQALLPDFCQDAQTFNGWMQHSRESPRSAYWISKMGQTFWAVHHYCWAAIRVTRSRQPGLAPVLRDGMLEGAVADFVYVLDHSAPDMVLLPEIYYLIGEARREQRQFGPAIEAYKMSQRQKADYWPAYTGHADLLVQTGLRNEARTLLEAALKIMPEEKQLLSRLEKLKAQAADRGKAATPKRPAAAGPVAAPAAPTAAKAAGKPSANMTAASASAASK